ncbi:proline-rich transmembrane protein 1-like isoform X2 [Montipora capricornis]|uniref:proline-rich transmembrane protein 1-like isoform X2 n=1 Tax=Montipora capricornis TaxID=246305 RepID=UPI0035F164C1
MADYPQGNLDPQLPPCPPPPYSSHDFQNAPAQYPPPGQDYGIKNPSGPVTQEPPVQGANLPQFSYPTQPPHQYPPHPGYQAPVSTQPGYQYPSAPITTQHNIVTVVQQGGPGVILAPQVAPPDYCGLSWFACLCCCWLIGIFAILRSNQTRDAILRGDMVTANQLSTETRKLANTAIVFGVITFVVSMIVRSVILN